MATETLRFSLMRLMLIIFVVYVHIPIEPNAAEVDTLTSTLVMFPVFLQETFLRFSVMVLTALSGFIMFYKEQDRHLLKTSKKKFFTLVIPFLFWNIPLVLALYIAQVSGLAGGQRLNLLTADWQGWADALFSMRTRPVNYPLYFIRDLFVVSLICLLFSKVIRLYPLLCVLVAIVICEYNADSFLIIRTPMLTAFLIGATLAIYKAPLNAIDPGLPFYSILLAACCILQYLEPSLTIGLCLAVVGGLWVWSFSGWALQYNIFIRLAKQAKYAFPIYLMHGIILAGLLMTGIELKTTPLGTLLWVVLPALIVVASAWSFYLFKTIFPDLALFVTGGRGA